MSNDLETRLTQLKEEIKAEFEERLREVGHGEWIKQHMDEAAKSRRLDALREAFRLAEITGSPTNTQFVIDTAARYMRFVDEGE